VVKLTFPRELRLLTPAHFQHVFAQPERVGSPQLTILTRANTLDHPRLGLAVSKKHLKRAITRNRAKRIIRDHFRRHQQQLPAVDMVVIVKAPWLELDTCQCQKLLDKSWQRVCRRYSGFRSC